jgi:hypothetical protein
LLAGEIVPENVPLIETEIGVVVPSGSGPVSVICSVKVFDASETEVLVFIVPEMENEPRVGLPFVVIFVELCGV